MSELDVSRLRFNQVAMLGFQCFVEIFVDYVCIVMEMAAGIEFDRIEGLILANGCFYSGNIFSLKLSKNQSQQEFLMATLVWTAIVHAIKMTAAYLPSMMTQRFRRRPDYKPSLYFCLKKIVKGTQTDSFLVAGTCAMAVAELCLRAGKATYVARSIRRRATDVEAEILELSASSKQSERRSVSSLKLEFDLWKRQIVSYHTAELTADMYAEYIAIGCSQSIIFWWSGHPFYPALQLGTGGVMSPGDVAKWGLNQVAMLGFQFVVEIFVDYVCVVVEMASGIDFTRIESRSTFLGVVFMMMAVLNINISSLVYLSFHSQ
ncbi:uncharacterized protein PITG_15698 [Phytophthora infestans T30-4]|uniref:Transmembrane protein n=1 Tax=Phytophthora infestans (strain T30-4) TaxID=403677 RepID=D0NSC9_PHYIT|nr:uncharacterized protein PITG_15698 [Phytophthora infestans T30-4]EEY64474.1 conserved hypothetical protein [Phytophthora infestans T30-4]|eukprot:XP_002897977.1 conserved hypothetical protein [Phytophthora infestans T30-4]